MDKELIREVANAVFMQELLTNWHIYALMACMWLIFKFLDALIGPYVTRRAEALATKVDFENAMVQIRATTKATEAIRVQITKTDWLDKEWRTIRRVKLEELLTSANRMRDYITNLRIDNKVDIASDSSDTLTTLCALYFPELRPEVSDLFETHKEFSTFHLDCQRLWLEAISAGNQTAADTVLTTCKTGSKNYYGLFLHRYYALEQAASSLMQRIAHQENNREQDTPIIA